MKNFNFTPPLQSAFLIALLICINLQGQNTTFDCGFVNDPSLDPVNRYSYSTDLNTLNSFSPVVHNIFIWGINKDDGSNDDILLLDDALSVVATLNIEFNQFNIFFKFSGMDYINETVIYNPADTSAIHNYATANNLAKQNAINFYVPYEFSSGIAGSASTAEHVGVRKSSLNPYAIIHEMGHFYNLRHTFQNYTSSYCEQVTRDPNDLDDPNDPNDTYFNADVAGDRVVDTAACGILRGDIIADDCSYIGNGQDCKLADYEIFPEDVQNYMGYIRPSCASYLSTGQAIRMHEKIDEGIYANVENTFAALYEPYTGTYYFAGPMLPPSEIVLFQPGFDYWFIECNGPYPQPADYGENFYYNATNKIAHYTKEEQNYTTITHPNHTAIKIKQVETTLGYTNIQKCYDNYNRSPSGGTITKFNDNVFNTNVTITPQDSLGINNQQLIEQLPSGLYNIEKNYEDGSTEQTVIIKENN